MRELNINELTGIVGGASEGEGQTVYSPPERGPVNKYAATGLWTRVRCNKCRSLDVKYIVVENHSVMMCRDCGSLIP